jgi:nucleotide-binding universal stress UspA family protein
VDGSPCARKAFDVAAELVKAAAAGDRPKDSSVLYILTVVQPVPVAGGSRAGGGGRKGLQSSLESLAEKDARVLLAEYATMADIRGIKAETILAKGHPAKVIAEVAAARGADMIAVGSRGLGGVRGMILGSVSHAVLHNSKVPVLVAK